MLGHVLGDLNRSSSGRLEGWCWASDRPRDRLVVEVLINGEIAASLTAARLDISLQETGIGDGYHAFSLPMPSIPKGHDDGCIIEARERVSRSIFGRIVLSAGAAYESAKKQIAEANTAIRMALDHPKSSNNHSQNSAKFLQVRELALMLKTLACSPKRIKNFEPMRAVGIGLQLIHELPVLSLPWVKSPALTLIAPASKSWKDTHAAVRNIAPLLKRYDSELIVVDNGDDPLTALAGTQIRNLNFIFYPGKGLSSAAKNAAALVARGQHLYFFDDLQAGFSRVLMDAEKLARLDVIIGSLPSHLAVRLGMLHTLKTSDFGDDGAALNMLVKASVFAAVQGFNEMLNHPSLAAVDFALKAALLAFEIRGAKRDRNVLLSESFPLAEELSAFSNCWGKSDRVRAESKSTIFVQ